MSEKLWAAIIGGFLLLFSVFGGYHKADILPLAISNGASVALLIAGVWRLRSGFPSRSAVWACVLAILALSLMVLQLVPMPAFIWQLNGAQQIVKESLLLSGLELRTLPLSLGSEKTTQAILNLVPALAVFIATLSLDKKFIRPIVYLLIAMGIANGLLGLLQKFQGSGGASYLWLEESRIGSATGTFYNRNHLAAYLYIMLPMVAAAAIGILRDRRINGIILSIVALVFAAILVIGLGATGSRAGIALAMAAVVLSGFLAMSKSANPTGSGGSKWLVSLVLFGFFVVAQFGLVGILRLAETDPITDIRTVINQVGFSTFQQMLPFGSGFGNFLLTYQLIERPEHMIDAQINQAHNDWLEIAIDGGIPAIILLGAFLLWFMAANFALWRQVGVKSEDLLLRGAGIAIFLLLCHSLVDYPLRAQAISTIFAFCCGLIALGPSELSSIKRRFRSDSPQEVARRPSLMPVQAPIEPRKGPYFVKKEPIANETPQ